MEISECVKLMGEYVEYSVENEQSHGHIVKYGIGVGNDAGKLVVGIEKEDGFIEEYLIEKVKITGSHKRRSSDDNNSSLVRETVELVDKAINSFRYNLSEYYKELIMDVLQNIEDEGIKETLVLLMGKRTDISELINAGNVISAVISEVGPKMSMNTEELEEILRGLVAYEQKDNDTAYSIFSKRWLRDKNNLDACRDFILVADQFGNDVLCFFLLKHFFTCENVHIDDKYYKNLWMKFLFYSIKYNNFQLIKEISVNEWNVRTLFDSYIYILYTYNYRHMSERLADCVVGGGNMILQQNNADFANVENAIEELKICRCYLPDTAEGFYMRFEKCMGKILDAYETGNVETYSDEGSGYIYEFVKLRNYGFIIGFDFQTVFYHWDDSISRNVKERVMKNIYSDKSIEEEEAIFVNYYKVKSKKTIQATDII